MIETLCFRTLQLIGGATPIMNPPKSTALSTIHRFLQSESKSGLVFHNPAATKIRCNGMQP